MILALLLALVQAAPPAAAAVSSASPEDRGRIAALARLPQSALDEGAQAQIREGLTHPHPSVRAAAARVAHVIGGTTLLKELRAALKAESELVPARELTWALADLDTSVKSDGLLADVVARPDIGPRVLSSLVAGRGVRFLGFWPRLKTSIGEYPSALVSGLEAGLHGDLGTTYASFALRDGMDRLFESLLTGRGVRVDSSVMAAALASPSSRIRTAAAFRLAEDGGVVDAAALANRPAPASTEERVAMILLDAAQGAGPSSALNDAVAQVMSDEPTRTSVGQRLQRQRNAIRGLTPEEREGLFRALGFDKDQIESARGLTFPSQAGGPRPAETLRPLKTLGGYPDDYVRSVLESVGCQGGAGGTFEGAELVFRPGGRAEQITPLAPAEPGSPCREAAQILATTALASRGDAQAVALLPNRQAFLACLAEPDWIADPARPLSRPGGGEPPKVTNVNPGYPEDARRRGKQGDVVLEAVIRPSGCIADVRLLRSLDDLLDLAAVNALSGWVYEPTVVDGVAVPLELTVNVHFRLVRQEPK